MSADFRITLSAAFPIVMDELAQYGFLHSCIDASALLTKVLHGLGVVDAYPLTVGVQIINAAFRQYVDAHGAPFDDATAAACNDAGGAMVVLGKEAPDVPDGNWRGHLVVIVPNAFDEMHAMLDLTIPQANWREFGIVLPPLCPQVTQDFVSGRHPAKFDINACVLTYRAFPDDRSYEESRRFMKQDGFEDAVSSTLRRIRASVGR